MAISDMKLVDIIADVEECSESQCYKILLAMKQNPPEGVDVLREAICAFEALEDLEVYHFFKEMRKRYDAEDWEALTTDAE